MSNRVESINERYIGYGEKSCKNNPFGYGNLGVGVVFEHCCLNNTV
ncbi:MAG: hypothetical protein GX142_01290 [Chloroflexi bacterium]|nr:hypothetical protein [Chloroflexota bacterium]